MRIPACGSISLRIFLAIFLFCIAYPTRALAARSPDGGTNAAEFLRLGRGARAPGMGDAATARVDGVPLLHYNPAALGWIDHGEVEATYQSMVLDISNGSLGIVKPVGKGWGLGLSFTYLDYGNSERTTITTVGATSTSNTVGTFGGDDFTLGLSYGSSLGSFAWGMTGRGISSSIDNSNALAFAADFGLLWQAPSIPIQLGITLKNLGTKLVFDRDGSPLPLLVRGGISYAPFDGRLVLNADLEKLRSENWNFMTGAQYQIHPMVALRVGYDGRNDADENSVTLGASFSVNDLAVDYAYLPFGKIGDDHKVALRYAFGGGRVEEPTRVTFEIARPPVFRDVVMYPPMRQTFFVQPFILQHGDPKDAWVGAAVPTVFHHLWSRSGLAARNSSEAIYSVEGDYWVVNERLIMTARLINRGREIKSFEWSGEMSKAFLLFDDMVRDVNAALTINGASIPAVSYPRHQ